MGGDVVVGAIIFSMLLMVNFVVITKGSSRIAEVAARFYLDSMPGKQMAIDADLSTGTIDEPTARHRRAELSEESGFYGAMDGASKFVRGDAISALVITLINIFGGLAMGLFRAHMSVERCAVTYTTLTVGDGLVSQIPALLVSTAAGIVVSKGAIEGKMHGKLASQLGQQSRTADDRLGSGRRPRLAARPADDAVPGGFHSVRRRGLASLQRPQCGARGSRPRRAGARQRATGDLSARRRARGIGLWPAGSCQRRPATASGTDQAAAARAGQRTGLRVALRAHPGQRRAGTLQLRLCAEGDHCRQG